MDTTDPINQLESRLRKIDERLADIQQGIAECKVMYSAHGDRIKNVEQTLYSNGLVSKVSALLWICGGIGAAVLALVSDVLGRMISGGW